MVPLLLLAALHIASGGVVEVPCGYSFKTPIVISAPVTLRGRGQGGTAPIQIAGSPQSCAMKWLGKGDAIIVRLPQSKMISGVTFENLTLVGNRQAGSGIVFEGGDIRTQMDNIFLDKLTVRDFPKNCITVTGNVFLLKAWGVSTIHCDGNGWQLSGSSVSQIRFFDCLSLQNGRDGFYVNGPSSGIEFFGTTSSNNAGWGVRAPSTIDVFGGQFENNTLGGIESDSAETVVIGASVPVNKGVGIFVRKGATVQGIPNGHNGAGELKWK